MNSLHIYLDESGDLGFDPRSSKYIVIALLITKTPLLIGRCIKKIRQRKLKKKLKELPEIKFNKSDDHIREPQKRFSEPILTNTLNKRQPSKWT